MTTQVADWHEKARELMPITISPLQSIMGGAAHGGHVASRSGTSEGTERDRDRNSKIRARLTVENHLLSTTHAVGSRASQRREQEVFHQKVGHTTRLYPVHITPHPGCCTRGFATCYAVQPGWRTSESFLDFPARGGRNTSSHPLQAAQPGRRVQCTPSDYPLDRPCRAGLRSRQ